MTFIDQYNITVFNINQFCNSNDLSIFYNCGDMDFKFSTENLFFGPDFRLTYGKDDYECESGSCYFKLDNQKAVVIMNEKIKI